MDHPSLAYLHPYETAKTIFGFSVPADELLSRVRTFSWRRSFHSLAQLAAIVANTPGGANSERVRRLTIDPLTRLPGQPDTQGFLERARQTVSVRRSQMILAHEEAILFLQHVVLLEGASDGDGPAESEIALWLAIANDHLERWQIEDSAALSEREQLAAQLIRLARFNNASDLLRTLVRTISIFSTRPPLTDLNLAAQWERLQEEAFGRDFMSFFETGPGLLAFGIPGWGVENHPMSDPLIDLPKWLEQSRLSPSTVEESLKSMIATREAIVADTKKRMRSDGLPLSPTALLHTPLVTLAPSTYSVASPWAVLNQMRTGIWFRYLRGAQTFDPERTRDEGADLWFSAFGYMVENWCVRVAHEAEKSVRFSATLNVPTYSGSSDEVEDVVLIEGDKVILFSVKARLVEAKVSREAHSPKTTWDWYEKFFFAPKTKKFRPGACRQLSARIDSLRAGQFESLGLRRDLYVYPVLVTYDDLGEYDLLYKLIEDKCRELSLLQQVDVGPFAIAHLDEFELLMTRASKGRSVTGLLLNRERRDRHRRLDQVIYEVEPVTERLPFLDAEFDVLTKRISARLFRRKTT